MAFFDLHPADDVRLFALVPLSCAACSLPLVAAAHEHRHAYLAMNFQLL